MSVYETGINGEVTSSMIPRLRHYLDELKDLQFVILLGVSHCNFLITIVLLFFLS